MNLSAENNPTSDQDEDKNDSLDQTKDVHESDTETRGKGMYARNDDNNRKSGPPFSPFGRFVIHRNQDILCEDDTAGCCYIRPVSVPLLPCQAGNFNIRHTFPPIVSKNAPHSKVYTGKLLLFNSPVKPSEIACVAKTTVAIKRGHLYTASQ